MNPSDAALISQAVAAGDPAAYGELVLRHQSAVRQFLRHLARGDAALADDLAQDTFVQAYRSLAGFRGESGFRTWLLGIAHNRWRNARRQQRPQLPLDDPRVPESSVPAAAANSDLRHDLAAALRQLSPDEQTVLHLGYQQGLTHPEIATLLDLPLGTVKTHLTRGKAKLRELLSPWNPHT